MEEQRFKVSDAGELAIAKQIVELLDRVTLAREAYDAARAGAPAAWSELAADDAALGWMQLSHQIQAVLGLASDNLRAVGEMILDEGTIVLPMYAHYSILRSALEASAVAKWILIPDEQHQRLTRSLRARMDDMKRDRELHDETLHAAALHGKVPPDLLRRAAEDFDASSRKTKQKIREIAGEQSLPWGTVTSGLPGMVNILRAVGRADEVPGQFVSATWKTMSGLAHASASRLTRDSAMEILSETDAGIINARLTASMRQTHAALLVTVSLFIDAVKVLNLRLSTKHVGAHRRPSANS